MKSLWERYGYVAEEWLLASRVSDGLQDHHEYLRRLRRTVAVGCWQVASYPDPGISRPCENLSLFPFRFKRNSSSWTLVPALETRLSESPVVDQNLVEEMKALMIDWPFSSQRFHDAPIRKLGVKVDHRSRSVSLLVISPEFVEWSKYVFLVVVFPPNVLFPRPRKQGQRLFNAVRSLPNGRDCPGTRRCARDAALAEKGKASE